MNLKPGNLIFKVKAAFTRAYNKNAPLLPFAPTAAVSKKRSANLDTDLHDEDDADSDAGVEDNVETDTMIKVSEIFINK